MLFKPYTLDIWEYGGHPDLATGHQMFLSDCRAVTLVVFDLRQELDSPALVPRTLAHPDTGGRTFLHSYCDEKTLRPGTTMFMLCLSSELVEVEAESELTNLDLLLQWVQLAVVVAR